ncbi:hypothetical protein ACHAWF_014413 [Thalassiosira exigua]
MVDATYLKNVHTVSRGLNLHTNAGTSRTDKKGQLGSFMFWLDTFGIANVVSLRSLEERYHVSYDSKEKGGAFIAHTPEGDIVFKRCKETGFPYVDLDDHSDEAAIMLVQTVRKNYEGYTRAEVERAIEARKLQARTGHASEAEFKKQVNRKPVESTLFSDTRITSNDIANARKMFGPSVPVLKGKWTRGKPKRVDGEVVSIPTSIMERCRNVWLKVELERLRWVKDNQKTLRAEVYSGLRDAKKSDDGAAALQNTGKCVVLPSSFTGGDRYMHQQLMDTLALCQRFGWPHIFSTMTTNPDWPEIKQHLKPGQTVLDRPDLVARVFKLKKSCLYARWRWILSVQLPQGFCLGDPAFDGYPLYRRRSPEEGGHTFETWKKKEKLVYTNANVVPYSKYLLKKFRCHINVEYCYSIQSIKYLFKYFHKGSDQSIITVEKAPDQDCEDSKDDGPPRNEVLEYQTKRYIARAEATWHLRRNELASREPAVCRLPVHLPDQ